MTATEETAHGREPDPDLADVIRELSDRIEALQADVRRLGGPGLPASDPGWNDEPDDPVTAPSYAWVSAVSAPVRRRPTVPRLLLEVLFLVGCRCRRRDRGARRRRDRRRDDGSVGARRADRMGSLTGRSQS